jgi:hypothetical protein
VFNKRRGEQAWTEACSEADHLDPGWRWEDLLDRRPVLSEDCDAIRVASAAAAKLPSGWPDWTTVMSHDDLPRPKRVRLFDIPLLPGGFMVGNSVENRRLPAVQYMERYLTGLPVNQRLAAVPLSALRAVMIAVEEIRNSAVRLTDLSAGRATLTERPILVYLPIALMLQARPTALLLRLHALLAAEDYGPREALADGRALLGTARAAAEPPMLMTAIGAVSIRLMAAVAIERALAQSEPDSGDLVATQQDVQTALDTPLLVEGFRGERALNEDLVRAFDERRVTRRQIADAVAIPVTGMRIIDKWIDRLLGGGFSKYRMAGAVRWYTAVVELLKVSPDGPRRYPEGFMAIRAAGRGAVRRFRRAIDGVIEADRRQRALLASLAAALAAERFRRAAGRWPDTLDELIPTYLTTVPTDPYDLESLRYRHLDDGVVIYTLGPDSIDSGGEVRAPAGGRYLPGDLGVRLWDVVHRRQPPDPAD